MSDETNYHDRYVHRFQAHFEPVYVRKIKADGTTQPWLTLLAADILGELVIRPDTLRQQVDVIALTIGWWARMSSHTKRVVDIQERHLRSWEADFELKMITAWQVEQANKGVNPLKVKLPTRGQIEAAYRADPRYRELYEAVEEAEEARSFCEGMRDAFKVKARILERDIFTMHDGSLDRRTV